MRAIQVVLTAIAASLAAMTTAAAETPKDAVDGAAEHATVVVVAPSFTPTSPDIYGTVALGAGVTAYGARWRRVSAADEGDPRIVALAALCAGADPLARMTAIQREVGRRIGWRRDLDIYHVSDYWAQAGETLARGVGDSEDIAILKMQILKAAGFPARDLYLSVGRDAARGGDVVLVARIGDEFYALDDRSPVPVRARTARRFEPVITLGRDSAWIHGRRVSRTAAR